MFSISIVSTVSRWDVSYEVFLINGYRYIWESKADGNFAVTEDTENEPLGRGTEIRIYLKSDAAEYAQEDKLKVRDLLRNCLWKWCVGDVCWPTDHFVSPYYYALLRLLLAKEGKLLQ